ncbi:DUF1206 domain-containing protein [Spongisporangium articulatum]|uniref:DUF1206 domain-containing protein n=1 Tax=Spongisporangium articulatum TaxID=3362603 RepID=A0ABW8AHW2_9ACTN
MALDDRARAHAQEATSTAKRAAGQADSRWVQLLGQVGVAAIGVVHLLLAWLALQVAFGGSGGKSADQTGAMAQLAENAAGKVLLALMAIGFLAWAAWQAVEAAIGFENVEGKERTGKRVAAAAKAVIGLSLAFQAGKLVFQGGTKSSSQKQQDWTGTVLGWGTPGKALVVIAGLVIIGVAGYLVYDGWKGEFLDKIQGGLGRGMRRLGQGGYVARGVVYGVLGVLVVVAGVQADPDDAAGLDHALKTLADAPAGPWLLTLVALGLASFGVFSVLTAHRRREP